jgi:hypothetical protein
MDPQQEAALPAVFSMAEAEIAEMNGEIKTLAKELKGIKKRLKDMAIFDDRSPVKKRTNVQVDSTPEEELMYQHRLRYDETRRAAKELFEKLDGVDPTTLGEGDAVRLQQMGRSLRSMESEASEHLKDMRALIGDLRAREKDIEAKMISIVQERTRLTAQLVQHRERMDAARGGEHSTPELIEALAQKHNVTPDEVRALLMSKTVDAETR